jgi:hypothetical protein
MPKENVRTRVEKMLIAKPELKDNDYLLIAQYWYNEAASMGKDLKQMSAMQLLTMIANGEFTNSETIRRDRQMLQMTKPELRGKSYVQRKGKKQENVKSYLGYGH